MRFYLLMTSLLFAAVPVTQAANLEGSLDNYKAEGATGFSQERGKKMWAEENPINGQKRSCSSCHTTDPTSSGKHVKTGKAIEPMAASVSPDRYKDTAKIEKWFKRNCKWTLGRECTPQEKGDFLIYLNSQ